MKPLITGVLVASAVFATSVYGQTVKKPAPKKPAANTAAANSGNFAKKFEGIGIAINGSNVRTTTERDGTSGFDASHSQYAADINLQHTWAFKQRFTLGVGITLGIDSVKIGEMSNGKQMTMSERVIYEVTPGYAINDSVLLFGKITHATATHVSESATKTVNQAISGYGYGLGGRMLLTKDWYIQGSFDVINYANTPDETVRTDTLKNKSKTLSIGIGYKF